jgi:hypothetical protein
LEKKEAVHDEVVIARYLERVRAAKVKYANRRVVNMDETAWKDVQMARKTIVPKGTKSVHLVVNGHPRAGMSVIATISAAAENIPLIYSLRADSDHSLPSLMECGPSSPGRRLLCKTGAGKAKTKSRIVRMMTIRPTVTRSMLATRLCTPTARMSARVEWHVGRPESATRHRQVPGPAKQNVYLRVLSVDV